jgi:XTP/dITP diphosphohydrolase
MNDEMIVATGNSGKLKEILDFFSDLPFTLKYLKDYWNPVPDIPENGKTFYENASEKARWVFSRTGIKTLADDSGLEVDFLQGRPGVRSARFAGEPKSDKKNIVRLISLLRHCPPDKRTARFKCVLVLKLSICEEIVAEGVCEGRIDFSAKGNNGFGYDPVFIPQGFSETFAQLESSVKNKISHRGKALEIIKEKIYERYSFNL